MFKNVYEVQREIVEFCLNNYEQYVRDDVEEIGKALRPENKTHIANQVKQALDKRYSWYTWVVLVYNKDQDKNHMPFNPIKVPMEMIIVAVTYILKAKELYKDILIEVAKGCFKDNECKLAERLDQCTGQRNYFFN